MEEEALCFPVDCPSACAYVQNVTSFTTTSMHPLFSLSNRRCKRACTRSDSTGDSTYVILRCMLKLTHQGEHWTGGKVWCLQLFRVRSVVVKETGRLEDLTDQLYSVLDRGCYLGRSCPWRPMVLKTVFKLLDQESPRLLLKLARLILAVSPSRTEKSFLLHRIIFSALLVVSCIVYCSKQQWYVTTCDHFCS